MDSEQTQLETLIKSHDPVTLFRDYLPMIMAYPDKQELAMWIQTVVEGLVEFSDFKKEIIESVDRVLDFCIDAVLLNSFQNPKLVKSCISIFSGLYRLILQACALNGSDKNLSSIYEKKLIRIKSAIIVSVQKQLSVELGNSSDIAENSELIAYCDQHQGVFLSCIHFCSVVIMYQAPIDTLEPVSVEIPKGHKYIKGSELEVEALQLWDNMMLDSISKFSNSEYPKVGILSSFIFNVIPLAYQHPKLRESTVSLLLTLANRKHSGARQQFYVTKAVKNGLVCLLRNHQLSEQSSLKIMELLSEKFQSRADVYYLGQILQKRGIKLEVSKERIEDVEADQEIMGAASLTITPEQQSEAVVDALKAYAKTQPGPDFNLPAGFDIRSLGTSLVADMILTSLNIQGQGTEDGGVSQWQKVMAGIRQDTANSLQKFIDDQNKQLKQKKRKAPFELAPSPWQPKCLDLGESNDIKQSLKMLPLCRKQIFTALYSLSEHILDHSPYGEDIEYEEVDEDENLDTENQYSTTTSDGREKENLWLLERNGANYLYKLPIENSILGKRKADTQLGSNETRRLKLEFIVNAAREFKGSRAFWGSLISKWFSYLGNGHWFQNESNCPKELEESLRVESMQQLTFAKQIVKSLFIPFLIENFESRWDLAVQWLWQEWYIGEKNENMDRYREFLMCLLDEIFENANRATDDRNLSAFIPWLHQRGQNLLFRKFLTSLPMIPLEIVKSTLDESESRHSDGLILKLCNNAISGHVPTPIESAKIQLGLNTLYEVSTHFRPTRSFSENCLLEFCVSNDMHRRINALSVIQRWFTDDEYPNDRIRGLLEAISIENLEGLREFNAEWGQEQVEQRLDLYLWLCVKDPIFISRLLKFWPEIMDKDSEEKILSSTTVQNLKRTISIIGMPKVGKKSFRIIDAIQKFHPNGSEQLILPILESLYQPIQGIVLGSEITQAIISLISESPKQFSNPMYWYYLLDAEGLPKETALRALVILAEYFLDKEDPEELAQAKSAFCTITARLLRKHPAPESKPSTGNLKLNEFVHPIDVCVLFVCLDVAKPDNVPDLSLKKNIEVTNMLMNNPSVNQFFSGRIMCYSIAEILEKYEQKVPTLLLRTVISTLNKFKSEVSQFVLTHVLTRCVGFRSLWLGAKMEAKKQSAVDADGRRAKALWEGWVRVLKILAPQSFSLLVQIPKPKMKQILEKSGNDTQIAYDKWLRDHLRGRKPQERYISAKKIVEEILMTTNSSLTPTTS